MLEKSLYVKIGLVVLCALIAVTFVFRDATKFNNNADASRVASFGDSLTSGTLPRTTANPCGRSDDSWGAVLSEKLKADHTNYACSGATISDILLQMDALTDESIVFISLGANDVQLLQNIALCLTTDCDTPVTDFYVKVDALRPALLQALLKASGNSRQVVLSLYPEVSFASNGAPICESLAGLKSDTMIGMLEYINESLRSVAASVGDSVVVTPLENFKEHGICWDDSWVYGFDSPMVFHPNTYGHAMIAEAAYSAYKS